MTWKTPKIDWYGGTDIDGNYVGDRFNAADFNRIKNNLDYLREVAIKLYKEFSIVSLGSDRTTSDYFYADEINHLEENLNTINVNTLQIEYGDAPTYVDNGNMLESAILDLYNRLTNEYEGRRMLTWNFGMKGGEL